MDYLPRPDLRISHLAVPYFPGFEYDGLDFKTFPLRNGLDDLGEDSHIAAPTEGDPAANVDHNTIAFIQAWLYFGLIESFAGHEVRSTSFFKQPQTGSGLIIRHSSTLTRILQSLITEYQDPKNDAARERYRVARYSLDAAAKAHQRLCAKSVALNSCPEVLLSIGVLINVLADFSKLATNTIPLLGALDETGVEPLPVTAYDYGATAVSLTPVISARFHQATWCPAQSKEICQNYSALTSYYLSSIPRTEAAWISHTKCSEVGCLAYSTDQSTYACRHASVDCQCDLVFVSEHKIAEIVDRGGIPLIDLTDFDSETEELIELESTARTEYTAISHVWIDGMGNVDYCCLPRCQLQRLADMLRSLPKKSSWWHRKQPVRLLWMDTLCIPVNPGYTRLREKAINRMAMIYARAKHVLVLDTEHASEEFRREPAELSCARMIFSKWNSRCWTLQEAELAHDLLFWIGGRAIDIQETSTDPDAPSSSALISVGTITNKILMSHLRSLAAQVLRVTGPSNWRSPKRDEYRRFDEIWYELGRRTTTKAEDIHTILANLTDLLASRVTSKSSPLERTKAILHGLDQFPIAILYTTGHRPHAAKDTADRWIPDFPTQESFRDGVVVSCGPAGLEIEAASKNNSSGPIIVLVESGFFEQRFIVPVRQNECTLWLLINSTPIEDDELDLKEYPSLCLVIEPSNLSRGARLLLRNPSAIVDPAAEDVLTRYDRPVEVRVLAHTFRLDKAFSSIPVVTAWTLPQGRSIVIEQNQEDYMSGSQIRRSLAYAHKKPGPPILEVFTFIACQIMLISIIAALASKSFPRNIDIASGLSPIGLFVVTSLSLHWRRQRLERRWEL